MEVTNFVRLITKNVVLRVSEKIKYPGERSMQVKQRTTLQIPLNPRLGKRDFQDSFLFLGERVEFRMFQGSNLLSWVIQHNQPKQSTFCRDRNLPALAGSGLIACA